MKCSKCNIDKGLESFNTRKETGRPRSECKDCLRKNRKLKYYANIENERKKARERYHADLAKSRERNKEQYYKHIESKRKRSRDYGALYKQRKAAYNKANSEKFTKIAQKRVAERILKDPSYKFGRLVRGRLLRAIKCQYVKKAYSSEELLGCSIKDCREHIENMFYDKVDKNGNIIRMSWANHGIGENCWQIDHIVCICSFDLSDPEQQKKAFNYTNLRPLWSEEHSKKTIQDREKCTKLSKTYGPNI